MLQYYNMHADITQEDKQYVNSWLARPMAHMKEIICLGQILGTD